jgi:hypothetical protein
MTQVPSDEIIGRQILGVFSKNRIRPGGSLRRNHFFEVRDGDFQRGLNKAVENTWLKINKHDRYTYELTDTGFAAYEIVAVHRMEEPIGQKLRDTKL